MNNRGSLGIDRKIQEREREINNDSPLLEKESFRNIKKDYDSNRLNLNDKAQLYNHEFRKIQTGTPLKFITADNNGYITLNKEASTVFFKKFNS